MPIQKCEFCKKEIRSGAVKIDGCGPVWEEDDDVTYAHDHCLLRHIGQEFSPTELAPVKRAFDVLKNPMHTGPSVEAVAVSLLYKTLIRNRGDVE